MTFPFSQHLMVASMLGIITSCGVPCPTLDARSCDPGIGECHPPDPRERSPKYQFVASDPAVGLENKLIVTYLTPVGGDFAERVVPLSLRPTAICCSDATTVYVAGRSCGMVIIVRYSFELEEEPLVHGPEVLLRSDRLQCITCMHSRPEPPSGLVLLDEPLATLCLLDLRSSCLSTVATESDCPGIVGKKSFLSSPTPTANDCTYVLFDAYPTEDAISSTTKIEILVDIGNDLRIDRSESLTGAEYAR